MADRFGEYELLRRIGQGGMAEVWLARRFGVPGYERRLVVKRMLPELTGRQEFVDMFLDEARLAARFTHPNIVQVYELGEQGGTYFMAMELVDGPHLGSLFAHSLRARKPLPVPLCAYVVARAAEGLHHAHDLTDTAGTPLGIVHRDVSPQNVLISRQGDVKVMDFGVAKATTQTNATRTGVVKGKVSYMAPEQCLAKPLDRRTDVFALGIILHELCARRRLFRDKNDLLVMQRVTTEALVPPSAFNNRVSAELDTVVMHALERAPDKRTRSALELSDEIDAYLAGLPDPPTRGSLARWMEENATALTLDNEQFPAATPSWSQGTTPNSRSAPGLRAAAPAPPPEPATAPASAAHTPESASIPVTTDMFTQSAPVTGPGSEGDTAAPEPGGLTRRKGVAVAGAAFVAMVVLAGGWMLSRGPEDPDGSRAAASDAPASPQPAAAAGRAVASLRVMTEPPGAQITVNGEPRGATSDAPLVVPEVPTDRPAVVVATLAGHEPARVELPMQPGGVVSVPVIKLTQPAAVARPGMFEVTSEPTGLKVVVDGRPAGRTPIVGLELPEGSHSLVVEPPAGFQAVRASVRSLAGERVPLHYKLVPAAAAPRHQPDARPGSIVVDSSPWTNVYLGKKLLGPTPLPATAVPSGRQVLRLSRNVDGCTIEATRTMDVAPGTVARKKFTVEPRELRGSCQ